MLIDLHAKTSRSQGVKLSAEEIANQAKNAGLDAVVFCESLSSAHCGEALKACEKAGIHGFVGVEIPTTNGVVLGFVPEVGNFLLSEEWRQLTELVTPTVAQVVELFEVNDGVVIASRPYDLEVANSMGDHIFNLSGLKGVEVFTSGLKPLQADFALEAAAFLNLPTVGGSNGGELSNVGRFATLFAASVTSQAELVNALKDGEFWAVHIGAPEARRESRGERPERTERPDRGGDRGPRNDRDRGGRNDKRGPRDTRGPRDNRGPRDARPDRPAQDRPAQDRPSQERQDRPTQERAQEKPKTEKAPEAAPASSEPKVGGAPRRRRRSTES